jgi:hypothetical protein
MTVLTKEEMVDYQKHKDSLEHPEDMRYTDVEPPVGVCKNRYCPEPRARHDDLVRGYCAPCASIRRPLKGREANTFVPWQDGRKRTWSNMDQDWSEHSKC